MIMEITIGGKERELRFGVGFVRKLDDVYRANVKGIEFGAGLVIANMQLAQMNPATLSDVIQAAVSGKKVTTRQVDVFVDDYAEEHGGLKSLFEEIEEEMGKSLVVKDTLKQTGEATEELEED